MPALFVFLLKVNIALLLFCAGYYLVLRHLTFYTLNRIYLVAAILFATAYPQINLDGFARRHQQLAQPVQAVVLNLQAPAETLVKPLTQPAYWHWAEIVFFAGAALLAMRLLMQLFSLYKVYRNSNSGQIYGHSVRIIKGTDGPFSFWKNIYINPSAHQPDDLKSILQHEQVHADEWHTLDILLAELSIIFYWFNPGIWLMRKAVRENIEFITDRKILQKGTDSKKYQYSLLNVSFATKQPGIANHFNISTLKKRIVMMNAKRSSRFNLTRYAFLVPAVLICLLSFSFTKAELIKKSKTTYKVITLSVAKITNMATENPGAKLVTTLFHRDTLKLITRRHNDTMLLIHNGPADTGKRKFKVFYNYSIINVDTAEKIGPDRKKFLLRFNTDSNHIRKVRINGREMKSDSIVYFVNGVKTIGLKSLNADDIQHIEVMKNDPANHRDVILISTDDKNNHEPDTRPEVLVKKMRGLNVNINGVVTRDTVDSKSASQQKLKEITVAGFFRSNREAHIENLSTKLIFIDGKEATERDLKKLSAADIKSMSTKSGEEVTKQYGDKAKEGVLFITTKK